ncbi:MAG: Clp protease N-terminal domain-containing protein, partial [Gemmatimonadaceae bacterium]
MNGYNFTERVRKVLALAREESHALNHEYVGTEHILLGLMTEGEGIGMAALRNLGIKVDELRPAIGKIVLRGRSAYPPPQDLPYTSRAK